MQHVLLIFSLFLRLFSSFHFNFFFSSFNSAPHAFDWIASARAHTHGKPYAHHHLRRCICASHPSFSHKWFLYLLCTTICSVANGVRSAYTQHNSRSMAPSLRFPFYKCMKLHTWGDGSGCNTGAQACKISAYGIVWLYLCRPIHACHDPREPQANRGPWVCTRFKCH